MSILKEKIHTIDVYIRTFPKETQMILERLRKTIKEIVPSAEEAIAYGIPTFKLKGNLVHFAAYKNHIGFYPTPSGINAFKSELSKYKLTKGTIQFPISEPLPIDLIERIVKFRAKENLERNN
ncbi:MAG: DUF1801 domain-containing protein [Candidatus Roizmanbacteria bacterium]|nr:DUF1801 domain-containing protein [Candidatus Roizmanbacteria bacterium]